MYKHEILQNDKPEEHEEDINIDVVDEDEDDDYLTADKKNGGGDIDDKMEEELDEEKVNDMEEELDEGMKKELDDEKDEDIVNDGRKENNYVNSTFVNPSQMESEIVEFDVFVKCKDHWLRNDQMLYTQRLNSVLEVEKVENLWITPTKDYQVGSDLPTNIKFKTKFGDRIRKDDKFRESIWKKLEFSETCTE